MSFIPSACAAFVARRLAFAFQQEAEAVVLLQAVWNEYEGKQTVFFLRARLLKDRNLQSST